MSDSLRVYVRACVFAEQIWQKLCTYGVSIYEGNHCCGVGSLNRNGVVFVNLVSEFEPGFRDLALKF